MEKENSLFDQLWSSLPVFDPATIITTLFGAVLSLGLFYVGYRKTIGAREERIKAVNRELTSSLIQRIAVEREPFSFDEYSAIRDARAKQSNVPSDGPWTFTDVLNVVFAETVDNRFLDKPSKAEVIDLIKHSRSTEQVHFGEQKVRQKEGDRATLRLLGVVSGLLGSLIAVTSSGYVSGKVTVFEFFYVLGAAFVMLGAAITFAEYRRRNRMSGEVSFRRSQIVETTVFDRKADETEIGSSQPPQKSP